MSKRWLAMVALMAVWALAATVRLAGVEHASALGDAIHPWWAAFRDGWPRPHAPVYGWALVVPYKICSWWASDLTDAVRRMVVLHAAAAPIAAWISWRLRSKFLPAALVGVIVAFDPGLLDTVRSGAEGYLAPVWVALVGLASTAKRPALSALSLPLWAVAVMHHPMALAAAPLLVGLRWRSRPVVVALLGSLLMLGPRLMGVFNGPLPTGGELGPPSAALGAYVAHGGTLSVLILLGPVVGLVSPRTRTLSIRVLAALAILGTLGVMGGYLRDHHIRLLTVPSLVCWAGVPGLGRAVLLGGLFVPRPSVGPADVANAPGSLGLAVQMADQIEAEVTPPLVVDGAWLSGAPAGSPAAVMLDLHLRGWAKDDLSIGNTVVVVVSAERGQIGRLAPGGLQMIKGDRHALLVGQPAEVAGWSAQYCGAKFGGAWDAISVLHPETTTDELGAWWACP